MGAELGLQAALAASDRDAASPARGWLGWLRERRGHATARGRERRSGRDTTGLAAFTRWRGGEARNLYRASGCGWLAG